MRVGGDVSSINCELAEVIAGVIRTSNDGTSIPVLAYPDFSGLGLKNVSAEGVRFCACRKCRSVFSPAAYLVELLHWLDGRGEGRSALDVLLERRPDIGELELTCENTNEMVPYIDLVNEALAREVRRAGSVSGHGALTFDGEHDFCELEGAPQVGETFTVSMWVNPASTADGQCFIGKHDAAGKLNHLLLGYWDGGVHVRIGADAHTAGKKVTGWHHLAAVVERVEAEMSSVTVYRDGEVVQGWDRHTLKDVVVTPPGRPWVLGMDWDDDRKTDFFEGSMADVRLWGTALTQRQVRAAMLGAPVAELPVGRSFDGGRDYVEVGQVDLGDSFTVEMTIDPASPDDGQCFIGKHDDSGRNLFVVGYWGGGLQVSMGTGTPRNAGEKVAGRHHLTVVVDRVEGKSQSRVTVYRDGQVVPGWNGELVKGAVESWAGRPWVVGMDWDGDSRTDFFEGEVGDVRLWDTALGEGQVAAAMRRGPATWMPGHVTFDGRRDYELGQVNLGDSFTVEMTIDPASPENGQCFIGKHDDFGANLFVVGYWGGGLQVSIGTGRPRNAGEKVTGPHHLAVVVDRVTGKQQSRVTVYRDRQVVPEWDGELVKGAVESWAGRPWVLGMDWDGGDRSDFFRGTMRNVRLWPMALDAGQVRAAMVHGSLFAPEVTAASYPLNLPYDAALDGARTYLAELGLTRAELMVTSGAWSEEDVAGEVLGLSRHESGIIVSEGAHERWGLGQGEWVGQLQDASHLLARLAPPTAEVGIGYDELAALLRTSFVAGAAPPPRIHLSADGPTLGLDAGQLDRLHRFVRLQRRLGWSTEALDRAIVNLGHGRLDADLLVELSHVIRMAKELRVRPELLVDQPRDQLLMDALGITPAQLETVRNLTGHDPAESVGAARRLAAEVRFIATTGFTIEEVAYLVAAATDTSTVAPDDGALVELLREVRSGPREGAIRTLSEAFGLDPALMDGHALVDIFHSESDESPSDEDATEERGVTPTAEQRAAFRQLHKAAIVVGRLGTTDGGRLVKAATWLGAADAGPSTYQAWRELIEGAPDRLGEMTALADRTSVAAERLWRWATEEPTAVQAADIAAAVRDRHDPEAWPEVEARLREPINERQRDARAGWLFAHDARFEDTGDLSRHLLLDVQMDSCQLTSRVKQAISSVQLFVQQAMTDPVGEPMLSSEDARQWKWLKHYRVWEANRKLFLYPENWLEPELRDDKSQLFEELESELLQSEPSDEGAERAVRNYLDKLDEIARMEVVGFVHQQPTPHDPSDILHVFARTYGKPPKYFYRQRVAGGHWKPWEELEVGIEGDHLIPVVSHNRLYIFWPTFTEVANESGGTRAQESKHYQIRLAWSVRNSGRWAPKKLTTAEIGAAKGRLHSQGEALAVVPGSSPDEFFFVPEVVEPPTESAKNPSDGGGPVAGVSIQPIRRRRATSGNGHTFYKTLESFRMGLDGVVAVVGQPRLANTGDPVGGFLEGKGLNGRFVVFREGEDHLCCLWQNGGGWELRPKIKADSLKGNAHLTTFWKEGYGHRVEYRVAGGRIAQVTFTGSPPGLDVKENSPIMREGVPQDAEPVGFGYSKLENKPILYTHALTGEIWHFTPTNQPQERFHFIGKQARNHDRSKERNADEFRYQAAGRLVAGVTENVKHVWYRDREGHIQELAKWPKEKYWLRNDLTDMARTAPPAAGDPDYYTCGGKIYVIYRDRGGHIQRLHWNGQAGDGGQYVPVDLTKEAGGAPIAGGDPQGYGRDEAQYVVYRDVDGRIQELEWSGKVDARWTCTDLLSEAEERISPDELDIPDETTTNGQALISTEPPDSEHPAFRVVHQIPPASSEVSSAEKTDSREQDRIFYHDEEKTSFLARASNSERFEEVLFSHPYMTLVMSQLSRGIAAIYDPIGKSSDAKLRPRAKPEEFNWGYRYEPVENPTKPTKRFDFSIGGPYGAYNWELFFHVPFLVACHLSKNRRFEEAHRWFEFVFDPTEAGPGDAPARFWRPRPLHELFDNESGFLADLANLLGGGGDSNDGADRAGSNDMIGRLLTRAPGPLNPHSVARARPTAYLRAVVMRYLDNLIEWGDQLFTRDTMESNNEAFLLYSLAAEVLGSRPLDIPLAVPPAVTFNELRARNGLATDRLVAEVASKSLPVPRVSGTGDHHRPSPLGVTVSHVPRNDKLITDYWDRIDDRLFKLRHCMNIEGQPRQLPLFAPPIDPGLLARAVAAGVDLATVLSDVTAPMPHHRFRVLAAKASELAADVRSLGQDLLSALEKRDAEELALLQSKQASALQRQLLEIQSRQIEEAEHTLKSLQEASKHATKSREYFAAQAKDFMTPTEALQEDALIAALVFTEAQQSALALAAVLEPIGETSEGFVGLAPKIDYTNPKPAAIAKAAAAVLETIASGLAWRADRLGRTAGYENRQQDNEFFRDLAEIDEQRLDQEIAAAEIRVEITKKELERLELQIEQATEAENLLRGRFTNQQLYQWMVGQLSSVYFQSYKLAYDLAKRAEKAWQHELAEPDRSFIQFGYWDGLKKGLLAGERLHLDIKRMEVAYLDAERRDYELSTDVSIRDLDPGALVALQRTGECSFAIPEAWFDLDTPGHYLRRLKTVAVSIPTGNGNTAPVRCTLTLAWTTTRTRADGSPYERQAGEDPRFRDELVGRQSIVTSGAKEDAGLFEVDLNDDRYLPFEGAGAISVWELRLPTAVRRFDYGTIDDVVLHLRYTARDGGERLREQVEEALKAARPLVGVVSARHSFPDALAAFVSASDASQLGLELTEDHLPFRFGDGGVGITGVDVAVVASGHDAPRTVKVVTGGRTSSIELEQTGTPGLLLGSSRFSVPRSLGSWVLKAEGEWVSDVADVVLVLHHQAAEGV